MSRKICCWLCLTLIPLSLALGFVCGRNTQLGSSQGSSFAAQSTPLPAGPWGEMRYLPMTIAAPEQILPVQKIEALATRWWFAAVTPASWTQFLGTLPLPAEMREELLSPGVAQFQPAGLAVTPPPHLLFELPEEARCAIYKWLARFPENAGQLVFVPAADADERFRQWQVPPEAVDLFRKLSCKYGQYQVLAGLPVLLAALPSYEAKAHLLKSLTSQKTLMLRLHVTAACDLNALAAYWGRSCWGTDVQAMLESLAHTPKGLWVDVIELLPPLPTSLLYTFPLPSNPLNGPSQRRDCHWTTFNFFRAEPDPRNSEAAYIFQQLKQDYYPITSDPRFGDVVLFAKPDGSIIHSAVFVAGDVVFSKNGDTPIHPWMLATTSNLLEQYSFQVAPEEKLSVLYYRNKSF